MEEDTYLITISFVLKVKDVPELRSADLIRYFISENGGFHFSGDERDEHNNTLNQLYIDHNSGWLLGVEEVKYATKELN